MIPNATTPPPSQCLPQIIQRTLQSTQITTHWTHLLPNWIASSLLLVSSTHCARPFIAAHLPCPGHFQHRQRRVHPALSLARPLKIPCDSNLSHGTFSYRQVQTTQASPAPAWVIFFRIPTPRQLRPLNASTQTFSLTLQSNQPHPQQIHSVVRARFHCCLSPPRIKRGQPQQSSSPATASRLHAPTTTTKQSDIITCQTTNPTMWLKPQPLCDL